MLGKSQNGSLIQRLKRCQFFMLGLSQTGSLVQNWTRGSYSANVGWPHNHAAADRLMPALSRLQMVRQQKPAGFRQPKKRIVIPQEMAQPVTMASGCHQARQLEGTISYSCVYTFVSLLLPVAFKFLLYSPARHNGIAPRKMTTGLWTEANWTLRPR